MVGIIQSKFLETFFSYLFCFSAAIGGWSVRVAIT